MLSLFRQVDPIRIILLLLLFVLLKLPLILWGYPLTIPELDWMLLGEKAGGDITLYKDLWDTSAPLFALVYQVMESVFGQNITGYHIVANVFVFAQAILINQILNINGVFKEKTLYPALFFILFTSLFFDFNAFSPLVLSAPFLLFAMHLILQQFRLEQTRQYHYFIGLLISLATLCYIPNVIFMAFTILALGLYATFDMKKAILLLAGFVMPMILAWVYYYLYDATGMMVHCLIDSLFNKAFPVLFDWKHLSVIAMAPGALLGLSLLVITVAGNYTNYQYRVIRMMFMWTGTCIIIVFLSYQFYPGLLYFLSLPFAFFLPHLFQQIKRQIIAEVLFMTATAVMLIISMRDYEVIIARKNPFYNQYLVSNKTPVCEGKRILVLGYDPSPYLGNEMAGPYLCYPLAQFDLNDLDDYENIGSLYAHLEKDKPEYIVDQQGIMPKILYRIPKWDKEYNLTAPGVYKHK